MPAAANVTVLTDAEGAHLHAYLQALSKSDDVGSVFVADPSGNSEPSARSILGEKLKGFERDHGRGLSLQKADLAIVTTEGVKAPPVILAALEAGSHVLAEKPSCVRAEDFEPLVRLAQMKHLNLSLAFANRMRNTVQAARKLVQSGEIGNVFGCELHLIADQTRLKNPSYHRSWFADRSRAGGGNLIWLGIHWIDMAMLITGSKIVEAAGFTGIVGGQPLKIEDSAAMAVRFDNGSFGTIHCGYFLERGYQSHMKIWGSHGWLQLDLHGGVPLQWQGSKKSPGQLMKYDGPPDEEGYSSFVGACVQAAVGHHDPPVGGEDCLHVLKTVFGCYRAAETGRSQTIS